MLRLSTTACSRCGWCFDVCPNYVFSREPGAGGSAVRIDIRYPEQCCACGHCVAVCPEDAISIDGIPAGTFRPASSVEVPPDTMGDFLVSRRSVRRFLDKSLPVDAIERLLEVAVHAGTSSNGQNETFIILQNRTKIHELEKMVIEILWDAGLKHFGSSVGRFLLARKYHKKTLGQYCRYYHIIRNRRSNGQLEGMIFRNAPAVILSCGLKDDYHAHANCAIATRNIEIMAKSMGLGSCWVGFLTIAARLSNRIDRWLELPRHYSVYGALIIGYPQIQYGKTITRPARSVRWL